MVKLEGESLFNDAMCIALFMTLLNVLQGENFTVMGVLQTLLYEIFVAVIIGWAFGLGILRLLRGKHEMESLDFDHSASWPAVRTWLHCLHMLQHRLHASSVV